MHYYKKLIVLYIIFLSLLQIYSLCIDQNLIGMYDTFRLLILAILMCYLLSIDNPIYTTIIITCIIFIQTRIAVLPIFPENFTYEKVELYSENMSEAISIYIYSFIASISGVALAYKILDLKNIKKYSGLVPFDTHIKNKRLYYKICIIMYFLTSLLYVFIKFTTGLGIPGFNHMHNEYDGYSLVLFNSFASLGLVSAICYFFNLSNCLGLKISSLKLGILWFAIVTILGFSKAALIYAMMPAFFYFILMNNGIKKEFLLYFIAMIIVSIIIGGLLMNIRLEIGSNLTGYQYNIYSEYYDSILLSSGKMFLARLGSTFDVIYSTMVYVQDILPSVDFITEIKVMVNSLVPGSIFFVGNYIDLPFLIPHLFHGIPLESLGGHAENLPLYSYAYIFANEYYFIPILIVFFCYSILFRTLTSLYSRIYLLQFLMLELSNGGGIADVRILFAFYAPFFICLCLYLVFQPIHNQYHE